MVIRDQNGSQRPVKRSGRIGIASGWSDLRKKNKKLQVIRDQRVFEFLLGSGNRCSEMHVQILFVETHAQRTFPRHRPSTHGLIAMSINIDQRRVGEY
jgi:hypothetical protein